MIASELLAQKIQEIMGSTYKVLPFHLFSLNYTTPRETSQGLIYDVNYQAFEEFKNIVLAPVTATETALTAIPYLAKAFNYEVKFSIPADLLVVDKDNQLLETPAINFFADYKRLYAALNNTELTFNDDYNATTGLYAKTYKGNVSVSEPVFLGRDETGGGRVVYSVKGVFQISDTDVGTGNDTRIALYIKGTGGTYAEHFFENISNLTIDANNEAFNIQKSDKLGTEAETAVKGYQIAFSVGDRIPANNAAHQLLEDRVYKNIETLSGNETDEYKKRKVRVRLYKKTTLKLDFWAVLSVTYNATGSTSYGVYTVTLLNDEKGV